MQYLMGGFAAAGAAFYGRVYIDVYAVESTYAALRADTESKATSRKTIQNSIVKERTRLMDLEEQGAGHLKMQEELQKEILSTEKRLQQMKVELKDKKSSFAKLQQMIKDTARTIDALRKSEAQAAEDLQVLGVRLHSAESEAADARQKLNPFNWSVFAGK